MSAFLSSSVFLIDFCNNFSLCIYEHGWRDDDEQQKERKKKLMKFRKDYGQDSESKT